MKWIKKGLIYQPSSKLSWGLTHGMVPCADKVKEDIYRIYFSGRDEMNRSHIGYIEIDIKEPQKILRTSEKPVLSVGSLGCFDDNGVTPSWIINHEGKKYLYYIGWNKRSTVRMGLIAGLAVSDDNGETFRRVSRAPLLERTDLEPFSLLTGPCVLIDNGLWKMWYVSGVEWVREDLPRYNIKYAESKDGMHWKREGMVCIDFKDGENALARPCVIKEKGIYKMWYSYKGKNNYRIGYAESADGISWVRKDEQTGIEASESGWDSEMIEYSFVFRHDKHLYMLYNGNNYGEEGIGLAIQA